MIEDLGTFIQVRSREVHVLDIRDEIEAYAHDIGEADVILTQPISANYRDEPRLSLSWIEANKRPDAVVVRFLPLFTRGYLPSQGYLGPIDALAMPYHDYHLIDHYLHGTPADRVAAELDDPGFYTRDFLEGEIALDLEEADRRERENDVHIRLTRFIAEAYRHQLLFHTINHPSRLLLARLLNELFAMVGLSERVPEAGPDYLGGIRVSPYRSTACLLAFAPALFDDHVEAVGHRWRRTDFIFEQLRFYDGASGREAIEDALAASPAATAYLQRFHASRA